MSAPEAGQGGPRLGFVPELALYYVVVGLYFFAFGMQFVLFPSLVAFFLEASSRGVGIAQFALTAPMFCLLMFGGLLAERARAGPTLALLGSLFALASLVLCAVVALGGLTYTVLIVYAVFVGASAAFMMPVRDAALNGVLAREAELGRHTPISTAAATTTAVQIGAQIAGILVARAAGTAPAPFIALQALALGLCALASLGLQAPKPTGHERTVSGALKDIRDGVAYAFGNPIMSPMLISAAYAGVFVIGAFQVLFPLLVRDAYGGDAQMQAGRLGALFACFWGASFLSALLLSRMPPLRRPGRALIVSHLLSALALATLAVHKPFWAFAVVAVLWGFAAGVAISTSRTIVQSSASPRFLGRVLAVYSMGFMGGAPIGAIVVGVLAEQWGARGAAIAPAVGLAASAFLLALLTPLWRYAPETTQHEPAA